MHEKNEHQYIEIYGLRAIRSATQEPCFGNYFVKDGNRVFQCSAIDQAVEMVRIIRKDHNYKDFKHNLWKTKHQQRQKLKKQKAKLKQLTAVKSKVA